jgi:hypothetical protein
MYKKPNYLVLGATVIALLTTVLNTAAMAQVSGAIFTTNWDSTFVNGNVYDLPTEVFLNGGPRPNAPCSAAGLPDGYYYFQVTDPSGSELLSIDDIANRKVYVSGGLIVDHYVPEPHAVGNGKCVGFNGSNITVQLFPFSPTQNPGGEYKVWMTNVEDYDPSKGSFGFIPSKSKTDNFKVQPRDDGNCGEVCPQ